MPRPKRQRITSFTPDTTFFKPAGIRMKHLKQVDLGIDESEALKLSNIDSFNMEKAAKKMGVSKTTFHRILNSAYKKLTDAIINGKAIKIINQ